MDQRRFRSLCAAGIFLLTLAVNGRTLIAAFSGNYSADYVLARYVAALLVGYVGMRIMDSILFRPRPPATTEQAATGQAATGQAATEQAVPVEAADDS